MDCVVISQVNIVILIKSHLNNYQCIILYIVYVDVDPDNQNDPLLLIVNTANEQRFNRKWSIRIQQVPCHSPFRGKQYENE